MPRIQYNLSPKLIHILLNLPMPHHNNHHIRGKNLIQKAMERPDQVKKVTEKMSTDGILTTADHKP